VSTRNIPPGGAHAHKPVPPRLARLLLEWTLPRGVVGDSISGDLRQEFAERAATTNPHALRKWYCRQASKLAAHYTWDRARRLTEPRSNRWKPSPRGPKRRAPRMETLLQDIRFGARSLASNRGFTAVAVITLALGIGANTAMFSVINAVLLRPLEYPEPGRLVAVKGFDITEGETGGNTTPGNVRAWAERSTSFAAMATLDGDLAALTGQGEARRLTGLRSAGSLHEVLGVAPLFGRALTRADDAGGDNLVVLSFDLWRSIYGDNRDILGNAVVLDNVPHTIIGVMPQGFDFRYAGNREIDFWAPSGWSDEYRQSRTNYAHQVVARLAPGISLERAQQEMEAITAAMRTEYPVANLNHGARVVPLHAEMVAEFGSLLFLLMGAVGMVLLIATVNLANLLLARASSREQEIAVRRAVGATPGRLARQVLTESILLSTMGGVAGLGLAFLLTDMFALLIPAQVPYLDRVRIDPVVLGFTLCIATAVGIAFGLIPALRLSRQASTALGARGRGSRATSWTWSALVVAEVALSVVLLVGAGLLLHSFVNLLMVDPGFRPERVMTFTVSLPGDYAAERRGALWQQLHDELGALPGVTAAAIANQLPSEPNRVSGWFNYVDHPVDGTDRSFLVPYRLVSAGYFEALGIPVVRGRSFDAGDGGEPLRAIVNEAAARRFWPDTDALGDRISLGSREGDPWYPPATVVGVVGDVRNAGLAADTRPAVYFPVEMASGWTNLTFALRTSGDPGSVMPAARARVRAADPVALIANEITAAEMLARQTAPTRAILQLIGAFAGVGLAMATIGVFGVLSYSVSRRTREIGIRTALGANTRSLVAMVIGQAMTKVLAGTVLGVVASLVAGRFLAGMLYGVSVTDPVTITGVTLVLTVAALLASYLPARRAAKVDATVALRAD